MPTLDASPSPLTLACSRPLGDSTWYRIGAVIVLGWVAVAILVIVSASLPAAFATELTIRDASQPGRIAVIRSGTCYIGLKLFTTIPLLAVDTVANLYLSLAFLLPIWRSKSPQIL